MARQTQYAIGDLPPDCYRARAEMSGSYENPTYDGTQIMVVVNTNRRPLVVTEIEVMKVPEDIDVAASNQPCIQQRTNDIHRIQFLSDIFRVSPGFHFTGETGKYYKNFNLRAVSRTTGEPFEGTMSLRLYYHYGGDIHKEETRDYPIHFRLDARDRTT